MAGVNVDDDDVRVTEVIVLVGDGELVDVSWQDCPKIDPVRGRHGSDTDQCF